MLKSLSIKNYAIIDKLNIEFDDGFMCFTGETGAGKSIIVGALTFLLRGRSDTSIIKSGRDKAIVEGVFEIKDKEIISKLNEQDIDVDNNEVIVKRVISSDNRSSIKINQSTVTLSFLQDLFSKYVDIHSQKDAGYLYNKKKHIELLDKYAGDYDVIEDYLKEYRIFKKLDDEYNDLINNTYSEAQIDYLRYDFNELDEAKLSLEEENELESKEKKYKQAEKLNPEQRVTKILKEVQEKLHLPTLPNHIECFDNSNISGTNAVAGCVVYKKAKPSKKDYRKYIIKTVEGQDDYASMREVVYRRYSRMIEEGTTLPDLILTDGGKGHMESVRQVVEDTLHLNIPIVGLAKNDKHTTSEVLVGFPPQSIGLKPTDTLFRFLAEIQEEVHRFAITFHRDKRSKSQIASELDSIKGIGESSKKLLLKHFKSVKRISLASLEELTEVLPTSRASIIYAHFHPQKEP